MLKEKIIKKLDELIRELDELYQVAKSNETTQIQSKTFALGVECLAFVESVVGEKSIFYTTIKNVYGKYQSNSLIEYAEILKRLKIFVDEGWSVGIRNLISAEIFVDFLEMAEYFQNEGYKDPAAVIAGSVLEKHLRDLCIANEIPITKTDSAGSTVSLKAGQINTDLAKHSVYNILEQQSVTAWLALRNNAAHGKYEAYDKSQVKNMLGGIRDFIIRNPA